MPISCRVRVRVRVRVRFACTPYTVLLVRSRGLHLGCYWELLVQCRDMHLERVGSSLGVRVRVRVRVRSRVRATASVSARVRFRARFVLTHYEPSLSSNRQKRCYNSILYNQTCRHV